MSPVSWCNKMNTSVHIMLACLDSILNEKAVELGVKSQHPLSMNN